MISYDEEFYKRKFVGATMKDAYLKACKWYASNVLSKDELHNVHVRFDKDQQSPTVTIRLYAEIDESEVRKQHCTCCEEMHHSFFINENNNCNICAAKGYQNRVDQKMKIKKAYYRELILRRVGKSEEEEL